MPKTSNKAMAFKPSVAVFDACILYPFHLRDIIVQASVDGLVKARWTDKIHDEWMRNLAANDPTLLLRIQRTRRLMNNALPEATVSGYEDIIPTVTLPDPDDRHVLAAAIATSASMIVTWNLKDFPAPALKKHGLRRQTPDAFLTDIYEEAPELMVGSLENARQRFKNPHVSASGFIEILNRQKLTQLATQLETHGWE